MARQLGPTAPRALTVPTTFNGSIPNVSGTYTSPDGSIVAPSGALENWFAYRKTGATIRREFVGFGDSTLWGSGGMYSIMERLRVRAVAAGLADGGKGIFGGESGIIYDAPEINGFVSSTFAGTTDQGDNLTGNYYYDDGTVGHELVLQFRSTALRIWYYERAAAGTFGYAIKRASDNVQVASGSITPGTTSLSNRFAYVSGLDANTTYIITITNTGGGKVWIALAPVNETGLAVQKHAVSGSTFNNFFYGGVAASPFTEYQSGHKYQTALGLAPTNVQLGTSYAGATPDLTYADAARVKPILALSNLGFNDLSSYSALGVTYWTEYVKRFAAACRSAGCTGIVCSGQLPYNANWATDGPARFSAVKSTALAQGLVFADLFYPIGGPSLSYAGGVTQPHLSRAQYESQADHLWDNLLGKAA